MGFSQDPYVVMLLIIGVLILLGMFMETLSTIIILVPVLMPMLRMVGIDPIHFGVILVVTNEMALLTPPLGVKPLCGFPNRQHIGGTNISRRAALPGRTHGLYPAADLRAGNFHLAPGSIGNGQLETLPGRRDPPSGNSDHFRRL